MSDSTWGTVFANSETARGKIAYELPIGSFSFYVQAAKYIENNLNRQGGIATQTDMDNDKYSAGFKYAGKKFEGGVLGSYYVYSANRLPDNSNLNLGWTQNYYQVQPYAKATLGPLAIQAELQYAWGRERQYEAASYQPAYPQASPDRTINSFGAYLDAVATFGRVYVGGTFAYLQGPSADADKTSTTITGGYDWSPTLILFNQDRAYWVGNLAGNNGSSTQLAMSNAWFYQIKGGVKPTDKLDIGASVAWAYADTLNDPTGANGLSGYVSKNYGTEIDIVGSYKITNNLSYVLGVGYLLTGDYFKGNGLATADSTGNVRNNAKTDDYIVLNKLAFTF